MLLEEVQGLGQTCLSLEPRHLQSPGPGGGQRKADALGKLGWDRGGHSLTDSKIIFYDCIGRKMNIVTLHIKTFSLTCNCFPMFKEMETLSWTPKSTMGPGTELPGPDGEAGPATTLTPW